MVVNHKFLGLHNVLKQVAILLGFASLFMIFGTKVVQAESITIDESTDTNIHRQNRQYDISGGESAGNNIFHSFEKFGLNRGEIANFLAEHGTENIFNRVTGRDPSVINGLLKISGGNPNLFLVNPVGIIFGKNSSINLPASFTATTANGIQIGEFWFHALGTNNYEDLVGEAKGFVFLESDIGSIINLGEINVGVTEEVSSNYHGVLIDKHGNVISDSPAQKTGETINLVGGLIINTGSLNTPGGTINIVSVPDKQLVQVTPEGSLLS